MAKRRRSPKPRPKLPKFERYQTLDECPRGGMARVYRAFDPDGKRFVAIKWLDERARLERVESEIKALQALDHENVVRFVDAGELDERPFVVLEWVDGTSLKEELDRLGKGWMPVLKALRIARDILAGLQAVHEKEIVHRDIKPANVMLTPSGQVKIVDFGLARVPAGPSLTASGGPLGTPYYMPLEQLRKPRNANERSDVYSAGATLYHLLTGQVPYAPDDSDASPEELYYEFRTRLESPDPGIEPPKRLRPELPEALDQLVVKALSKNPGARPGTAAQFAAELETIRMDLEADPFVELFDGFARANAKVSSGMRPEQSTQHVPLNIEVLYDGNNLVRPNPEHRRAAMKYLEGFIGLGGVRRGRGDT